MVNLNFHIPAHLDSNEPLLQVVVNRCTGHPCPWPTIGSSMDLDGAEKTFIPNLNGGTARHIDSNPSSESFFNLATEWINSCKTQHSICAEADSTTTRNLPKRVIDVGPDTNNGIRVFEHDDLLNRLDEPYTALSHCWGKSQHLTSTHKNNTLDRWKQNIPFNLLPQTFQDAVVLTRKLNIKYVWIDSLCIIQDDGQDWEIEAAKMASIYNGADLVLAATGSTDGDGGCLFERAPFVTISGSFPDGGPYEIYGRASNSHAAFGWGAERGSYKGTENDILGEDPDVPLLSRAWCFQERLLATRILHFTRYEAVFDCLTGMECECGALHEHADDFLVSPRRIIKSGHKYVENTRSVKGSTAEVQARRHLPPPSQAEKGFSQHHELWRDMIVQYSTKSITYKKDGFPAIAGLATKWSNDITGRYLAGLWEKALLDGLRWSVTRKDSGKEHEYVAPSWSWLSVQREVEWGIASFDGMEYYVNVDYSRKKCHPKSDLNPFGEVSCGYIFLTGQITTMSYKLKGDTAWVYGEDGAYQSLSRVDSLHRLRNLKATELFGLRLGTKTKHFPGRSDSCALVLMKAGAKDLARQPREVREFPNVYQRVHFLGGWELGEVSEEKEMYLI